MKLKKILKVSAVIIIFPIVIYFYFFGSAVSPEDIRNNFFENEKAFVELEEYFNSITDSIMNIDNEHDLMFVGRNKEIILHINSSYIDLPQNELLLYLGWSKQTIDTLYTLLNNVNCKTISTGVVKHKSVFLVYGEDKWGFYCSYRIFQDTINKDMSKRYGGPIKRVGLGRKVVIDYGND